MKKFSETKVGKFLSGVAPAAVDALGTVFPPVKVLDEIFGDKVPPEKLAEFEKLKQEYELNELALYLEDVQNSRQMNIEIQKSDFASWLAKNTGYILDFVITISTIILAVLLYFQKIPPENKEISYSLLGVLFSQMVTVINWHRGSSKGSGEYKKIIENITRR